MTKIFFFIHYYVIIKIEDMCKGDNIYEKFFIVVSLFIFSFLCFNLHIKILAFLKGRFYFDYGKHSGGKNYTKRGNSLFNAITYGAYLTYDLDQLNDRIENPCILPSMYYEV